jgi:hypothetical protein
MCEAEMVRPGASAISPSGRCDVAADVRGPTPPAPETLIDYINIAVPAARSFRLFPPKARGHAAFHRVAETPEF